MSHKSERRKRKTIDWLWAEVTLLYLPQSGKVFEGFSFADRTAIDPNEETVFS